MHHVLPVIDLSRHHHLRAGRQLGGGKTAKEDKLGKRGAVGDDRLGRLPRRRRRLDPHHLHLHRRHLPRHQRAQRQPLAPVDERLGDVEQQVDHPAAAAGARHQARQRRADAAQIGQRREQRREQVRVHG